MKVMTRKGGTVAIERENIEEVDQFTYLGSIVNKTCGAEEDIKSRISKGRQILAMVRPVWKSTTLSENTKIRIFNTNVKSVLLYGAETWRLTKLLQQNSRYLSRNALDTYVNSGGLRISVMRTSGGLLNRT